MISKFFCYFKYFVNPSISKEKWESLFLSMATSRKLESFAINTISCLSWMKSKQALEDLENGFLLIGYNFTINY